LPNGVVDLLLCLLQQQGDSKAIFGSFWLWPKNLLLLLIVCRGGRV